MEDYKSYTNSELEAEIEKLTDRYTIAQNNVLENYQKMIELAQSYGVAKNILNIRNGKKADDK